MKKVTFLLVLTAIISINLLGAQSQLSKQNFTVEVEVIGIRKIEGELRIGVYSEQNKFASKTDIYDYRIIPVSENVAKVSFEIPIQGKYAIAILHDISKNAVMDYNFFGYPKEPYGFSNNPGIWYRLPTFEECAFEVSKDTKLMVEL